MQGLKLARLKYSGRYHNRYIWQWIPRGRSLTTAHELSKRRLVMHTQMYRPYGCALSKRLTVRLFLTVMLIALFSQPALPDTMADQSAAIQVEMVTTVITRISRESPDAMVVLTTPVGRFFTQVSTPMRTKTGNGFITLQEDRFESELLSHVHKPVVLTVCREVDGLVVGAFFPDEQVRLQPALVRSK